MKDFAIKFGKAMLGAFATVAAADMLGPKLPELLVIKGKDTRPYVAGAGALLLLMMLPTSVRPVAPPST